MMNLSSPLSARPCVIVALLLACALAGTWSAVPVDAADLGAVRPEKPAATGTYEGGWRTGGDTVEDATPIAEIPFTDVATTCGFADNYDWMCPYGGGIGPDAVYRYEPAADIEVDIDLCGATYDSKIYVYEDNVHNVIACNDDAGCGYSGWQSRLDDVPLSVGHVYYIVVDAYGSDCGEYTLLITLSEPCDLQCPPGAIEEDEPPCADGYYDHHNGGCQNGGWTSIDDQGGGCATLCGKSCTYLYQGMSYRDTDWFAAEAAGGQVTATCVAEFPLLLILIYGTDCANLQYTLDSAPTCEAASLDWSFAAGEELWVWVGSSVFEGVPESDYLLDLCGIGTIGPSGACCSPGGWCYTINEQSCLAEGFAWYGPGVPCDPNPCGQAAACCLPDGSCAVLPYTSCDASGGSWLWPLTGCEPDPCAPTPLEETTWGGIKARYR